MQLDFIFSRLNQFGLVYYRDPRTDRVLVDENELHRPRSGPNARIMADVQAILVDKPKVLAAYYAGDVESALEAVLTSRLRT